MVKTERGLELGHLVGQVCYKAGQFKLSPEQVKEYFDKSEIELSVAPAGKVIRFATAIRYKRREASAKKHANNR